MKKSIICACLILMSMSLITNAFAANGRYSDVKWENIFDGKGLGGWNKIGPAEYYVEDGSIVGKTVKARYNSFLRTNMEYGDFILELDFIVDPKMNSGVQIRSGSVKEKGYTRVIGYQVEIDPGERGWSCGIYDEARRGWLNNLENNEPARKAFKQNQWNHYRIEAIGDSIKTWINGIPAADMVDSVDQKGFIALQVHGTGSDEPMLVKWKNIRIKDLGKHLWKPLFDGKSFKGWHRLAGGKWQIKDGVIVGTSTKDQKYHGQLVCNDIYDDFTVRLKFKAVKGNSGLYFRVDKVAGPVAVAGFQAEIDEANDVGGIYETNGRGWVVQPVAEDVKKYFRPGKWNQMTVSAHGDRVVVHVNGFKTVDIVDKLSRKSGYISLQLHADSDVEVMLKDIEILEASKKYLWGVHDYSRDQPSVVTPGAEYGDRPGDAIVLFDGKDLSQWVRVDGGKAKWKVEDGYMEAFKGACSIKTKKSFGNCQLHIEWQPPVNPEGPHGQGNGNSGVFLMNTYEVQVLNCYQNKTYADGTTGAIYGQHPPIVNVCRKPDEWQSYDISFLRPIFDEKGKVVRQARVTVLLNGVVVQNNVEIKGPTLWKTRTEYRAHSDKLPISLQYHGNAVRYRNIWIRELGEQLYEAD